MATILKNGTEQHQLTEEDARKGGINSGIARKEKKLFRETIEKKLGASIDDIIDSLINKAKDGDVPASTFLRDTFGEKPIDKVEQETINKIKVDVVDE